MKYNEFTQAYKEAFLSNMWTYSATDSAHLAAVKHHAEPGPEAEVRG